MGSRVLAGLVPGFFATAAIVGLICWGLPGPWPSTIVAGIIGFVPLWMGVLAASFAFASARRAHAVWSAMALAGFALLWLLRAQGWVE